MIQVQERFEVPAPPPVVWGLLADAPAIVGCVPGAALVAQRPDGGLDVTLTVKFGPMSVAFDAQAVLELDASRMHGRLSATGRDKLGGARFRAASTFEVQPASSGSVVVTSGEVDISGRLASLIEGGANAVVKRMSAEFAACLSQRAGVLSP